MFTDPANPDPNAQTNSVVFSDATADDVVQFHALSDVNTSPQSQHHTLGFSPTNAAPGDRVVQGVTSTTTPNTKILSNRIIIGDEGGASVVLDPAVGVTLYAADGVTKLIDLDTVGGVGTINSTDINGGTITGADFVGGTFTGVTFTGETFNGGTINGAEIETSASDPAIRLGPAISGIAGYPAIEFTDSSGDPVYIYNNGNRLGFMANGSEYMVVNGGGADVGFNVPVLANTVDSNIFSTGGVALPRIYVVQVSFYTNGTLPYQNSVSYSCPFIPTKCVATSNQQGAKVDSVTSIGQYGCVVQVTQVTGASPGSTLVYVTLMLSA